MQEQILNPEIVASFLGQTPCASVDNQSETVNIPISNTANKNEQSIIDEDTRAVYEWFCIWEDECWGFPVSYHFPENLSLRMQRGRKTGEAPVAGSATVWKYEQPPIRLPEARIKQCLRKLIQSGMISFYTDKDSAGNVTEITLWRNS